MGVAYKLHCEHCSYNEKVYVGVGFSYVYLRDILEWFEDEAGKEQIRQFMNDASTSHRCYQGLYRCEKCRYLLNATYLHMTSNTESYTNHYDCPRCSERMPTSPLDHELDRDPMIACPACGADKLSVKGFMDWD